MLELVVTLQPGLKMVERVTKLFYLRSCLYDAIYANPSITTCFFMLAVANRASTHKYWLMVCE